MLKTTSRSDTTPYSAPVIATTVARPRWLLLSLAVAIIFIDAVGYTLIIPALPTLAQDLALGETRVGALYASYGLISLLLYLPFGLLVDRWGERSLLTVGMLILGCVSLGFWQATGFGSLLGCRFGQGIAASATWAAALPLAARIATKERRGVEMSIVTMAFSIGVIAGPALGSLGQVRDPFLYFAWLPFALAVCIFILVPVRSELPARPPHIPHSASPISLRDGLQRKLVCACLVILVTCATIGAIEVLLPLQFAHMGWSRQEIGLFFSGWGLAMFFIQPVIGWWSDRRGRQEPIRFGLLTTAGLVPTLFYALDSVWLLPLAVATIIALSAALVPTLPLMVDNLTEGQSGRAFGFYNMAFSLGIVFGPWAGGYATEHFNILWAAGLLVLPVIMMVPALPYFLRDARGEAPYPE